MRVLDFRDCGGWGNFWLNEGAVFSTQVRRLHSTFVKTLQIRAIDISCVQAHPMGMTCGNTAAVYHSDSFGAAKMVRDSTRYNRSKEACGKRNSKILFYFDGMREI